MIFARYPRPGEVNTRLVPPLSPQAAAQVQRACLEYMIACVDRLNGIQRILAITPDDCLAAAQEEFGGGNPATETRPSGSGRAATETRPSGSGRAATETRPSGSGCAVPHPQRGWGTPAGGSVPHPQTLDPRRQGQVGWGTLEPVNRVWPQGQGDLGERLIRATRRAYAEGARRLVIVGTDSPTVAPGGIVEAVRRLDDGEAVIGPCEDGGYYLVGMRVCEPGLFTDIDWGTHRVTQQTRGRAAALGLRLAELPIGYDIDRVDDLHRAIADLDGASDGTPEYRLRAALIRAGWHGPAQRPSGGMAQRSAAMPAPGRTGLGHATQPESLDVSAEQAPSAKFQVRKADATKRLMGVDDGSWAGCKVLVVEDHPLSLELLRTHVESLEGVEVLLAEDGPTALRQAEVEHPDLILLDVMMPRMSGFEVCRRLKEQPATRDIPVLLVTALDAPSDMERAAECRADGYVTKPFKRDELLDRVRSLLRVQRRRRAGWGDSRPSQSCP